MMVHVMRQEEMDHRMYPGDFWKLGQISCEAGHSSVILAGVLGSMKSAGV